MTASPFNLKSRKSLALVLLAMATGLAATPSFAQRPDCTGMGPGMGPGSGNHQEMRAERMQQRQKQLHDALKLSAEQESAWTSYANSMQPQNAPWTNKNDDLSKLSAPERAEKMLEWSKSRQERMVEHVAALKTFYATLTPEQKKAFDDFHAGPRNKGRGPGQGTPPAK